ncbi:hypothetical protein CRUP_007225 [Coryphaenoides rupestris]|nr:hypothetical protein CRUP_007225 [Coryphaenoides rupestris]
MVSWIISRIVVKWMMYWIVFALFSTAETVTDMVLSWFPFYFELKIAFVIWLLSPYTKGSSVLYRKFVHPTLSNKEREIDDYITQAKDKSYETMMRFGKRGLNIAATAAVTAATKDLTMISGDDELGLHATEGRSDGRTEQSDEDPAEKPPKRAAAATAKVAKKPAAIKTETQPKVVKKQTKKKPPPASAETP